MSEMKILSPEDITCIAADPCDYDHTCTNHRRWRDLCQQLERAQDEIANATQLLREHIIGPHDTFDDLLRNMLQAYIGDQDNLRRAQARVRDLEERVSAISGNNQTTLAYARQLLMLDPDCNADTFFDCLKRVVDASLPNLCYEKRCKDAEAKLAATEARVAADPFAFSAEGCYHHLPNVTLQTLEAIIQWGNMNARCPDDYRIMAHFMNGRTEIIDKNHYSIQNVCSMEEAEQFVQERLRNMAGDQNSVHGLAGLFRCNPTDPIDKQISDYIASTPRQWRTDQPIVWR